MVRSDQTVLDMPLLHVRCLEHYPVAQRAEARFNDDVGKTGRCVPLRRDNCAVKRGLGSAQPVSARAVNAGPRHQRLPGDESPDRARGRKDVDGGVTSMNGDPVPQPRSRECGFGFRTTDPDGPGDRSA
jgi:hypothetical protein